MAKRKPFVGGNWKMNLHLSEALALTEELAAKFRATDKVDVVICPAFAYLAQVGQVLKKAGSGIKLGAQDCYFEANGAFTGEVSLSMLKDVGVSVVLTGHSERRHVLGESDELINRKTRAALAAGLEVILCVGEKLEQREAGMTDGVNLGQTSLGLAGVKPEQMSKVTIAYEPVWAIGTGKTATPADAQAAHARIRSFVKSGLYNEAIGDGLRIQYGGSVKPANAAELFGQADIDGGLIGGASLKAADFLAILDGAVQ
ncbi:MAG: triose-phosphate isomerase [Phycisphaeraceae bacterium]|nr:triose-phosphate isomerase [Phycisphaeraceae bacterium]